MIIDCQLKRFLKNYLVTVIVVGFGQADVFGLKHENDFSKMNPPYCQQYRNVLVFANNFQMEFLILDHCEIGIYVAWCNRKGHLRLVLLPTSV